MYGVLFVIIAVGLLFSVSRASWIATAVALAIYLSHTYGGRKHLLITVGFVVVAITGAIALIVALADIGYQVTVSDRVPLWAGAIRAIAQQPYLGHGLGYTGDTIAPFVADPQLVGLAEHNSYLRMFLHFGAIGGLAYLVLSGWPFLKHLRSERIDIAFLAIAGGYLVNQLLEGYTMFDIGSEAVIMTIVFGYLVVRTDTRRNRHGTQLRDAGDAADQPVTPTDQRRT